MSGSLKGALAALRPAYYVPVNDEKLKASVRQISTYREETEGLSGHALAVIQTVCSVARALFINIPYYLIAGTCNALANCVTLNFERIVFGHYKAALQSLMYSALGTLFVAVGTFIPPALNSFKMEVIPPLSSQGRYGNSPPPVRCLTRPSPNSTCEKRSSIPVDLSFLGSDDSDLFGGSGSSDPLVGKPPARMDTSSRESGERREQVERALQQKGEEPNPFLFSSMFPKAFEELSRKSQPSSPFKAERHESEDEEEHDSGVHDRRLVLVGHLGDMRERAGELAKFAKEETPVSTAIESFRGSCELVQERIKRNGVRDFGLRINLGKEDLEFFFDFRDPCSYMATQKCFSSALEFLARLVSFPDSALTEQMLALERSDQVGSLPSLSRLLFLEERHPAVAELVLTPSSRRALAPPQIQAQRENQQALNAALLKLIRAVRDHQVRHVDFVVDFNGEAPERFVNRAQFPLAQSEEVYRSSLQLYIENLALFGEQSLLPPLSPQGMIAMRDRLVVRVSDESKPPPSASCGVSLQLTDSMSLGEEYELVPAEAPLMQMVNVHSHEMIGSYGVNLERQAHRVALDEYARVLQDDFGINLDEAFSMVRGWLQTEDYKDSPMVKALCRTLAYLRFPVAPYSLSIENRTYSDAKGQYETFIAALREVIATKQYGAIRADRRIAGVLLKCRKLVRALSEARFRSENHALLRDLLRLHEREYDRAHPEASDIPPVTRENFAQVLTMKNDKVKGAPSLMKVSSSQRRSRMLYGALGWEDFLVTDLPFVRGKQVFSDSEGHEREFYYMRHPTPHVPGSLTWIGLGALTRTAGLGQVESAETIATEFEEMLYAMKERDEGYLIQSHQRLNDQGKVENEDSRSQTLYRLQERHDNFHVVFQSVEGDLFERRGVYGKMTTFAELKQALIDSFYDETSPNRLPAKLRDDAIYRNQVIGRLFDVVHAALFDGRENLAGDSLSADDAWQAASLAFYILQGDDLKFRLTNIKRFSSHCKNFFDRGGNRAMSEDRLHQEMSSREITREMLEETIGNFVPVPLQSKGKGVIDHRMHPGLVLSNLLAKPGRREALQKIHFHGFRPDRFEVTKRPEHQRAVPLMEDAHTPQEVQEVFKALQGKRRHIYANDMVQKNWDVYSGKDHQALFSQINSDLERFTVYIDGWHYNNTIGWTGKYNAEGIYELLTQTRGMSDQEALKAMAQMHQGIFAEPLIGLNAAFNHDELNFKVAHAPGATITVTTTGGCIEVEAAKGFQYIVDDTEKPHYREMPYATFNTSVSVAIPKSGRAPTGSWTWEVATIPA